MTEMKTPAKPRRSRWGLIIILPLSLVLILMMATQMALTGASGWLSSGAGQGWLQNKIDAATAASGLHLRLGHVEMLALGTFALDHVEIDDAQGAAILADDIRLSTDPRAILATGTVPLLLTANSVTIHRFPQTTAKPQQVKSGPILPPFQLPHSFIHGVTLERLAVKSLTLDQGVAGVALALSPDFHGSAMIEGNALRLTLAGQTGMAEGALPLPQTINLAGVLTPGQSLIQIDTLEIAARAYQLSAKGQANLGANGLLDVAFMTKAADLAALSQNKVKGSAEVSGTFGGTADKPTLGAKGTLALDDYKPRGLGDIQIALQARNLTQAAQGAITIMTVYQKRPLTLGTDFAFAQPVLTLTNLKLTAPDATASGRMALNIRTTLADGTVSVAAKLDAYKDLIGAPVGGSLEASAVLKADGSHQTAILSVKATGLAYQTITVQDASLQAAIADIHAPWPDHANVTLADARLPGGTVRTFTADITRGNGLYALKLNGAGRYKQDFTLSGTADLKGDNASNAAAENIALKLDAMKGTLNVSGMVQPDRLDLALAANRLPLAALPAQLPDALSGMTVSGKGRLFGPLNNPQADAALTFSPLQLQKNVPAILLSLTAGYARNKAQMDLHGKGRGLEVLEASGSVPLTLSLKPFAFTLPPSTPLNGKMEARLDVAALQALMPQGLAAAGHLSADGAVDGTLSKPVMTGSVIFANGSFTDQANGVVLKDIGLQVALKNNIVTLASLHATDGGKGILAGSGTLALGAGNATDIRITATQLNPFRNSNLAQGTISVQVEMKGSGQAYIVNGSINPEKMDITIPAKFASDIPQLNIVDPHAAAVKDSQTLRTVTLNMTVHAPNQIFVRGWGLDAEFGGDLTISGTLADPQMNGTLSSLSGRYAQFNKRFDLNHANLRFQGSVPPSPYLDIEAQTVTDSVTGIIDLTGTAKDPKITLTSDPVLPQDEVLSHILFGKDMTNISPFQAIQLASTVQQLTGHGGGGPGLLDTLRKRTGLDDLEVNNDDSGGTTVGAGKYLTDKVYLQIDAGASKTAGDATVKYELTPHLTVNSKISQDEQAGGGVSWSWDY